MAQLALITVKESVEELQKLIKKSDLKFRPRLKMLFHIASGITSTEELVIKAKANRNSISTWKKRYLKGGIELLLSDKRGGNNPSSISSEQKLAIYEKLSNPIETFTSYKQAAEWINDTFSVQMSYHAVNQYLKRSFGTKLKVGRKSHVKKDEAAIAVFKKPTQDPQTY